MLTIKLEDHEVDFLMDFVRKGHKSAKELTRACILLLANQQNRGTEVAKILGVSRNTTFNLRRGYVEEGLPSALLDKPRSGQSKKYTEKKVPRMKRYKHFT